MSANPELQTGHPDIDREHAVLMQLLRQLDDVCTLAAPRSGGCDGCGPSRHGTCESMLVVVMTRVLGFTVDHFAFEEKAMRGLLYDVGRARHLEAHIRDHERIVGELSRLALSIRSPDLAGAAIQLQAVVRSWLGEHILNFDVPMVGLLASEANC